MMLVNSRYIPVWVECNRLPFSRFVYHFLFNSACPESA